VKELSSPPIDPIWWNCTLRDGSPPRFKRVSSRTWFDAREQAAIAFGTTRDMVLATQEAPEASAAIAKANDKKPSRLTRTVSEKP
jgi:hypothetical protein